jgi:amidophosphoribosyltransferase
MGRRLAQETGVEADVVVPVPDSGVIAAMGYSQESKIPLEFGLIRNHYVGRTFIEPRQSIRNFGVKVKLNPVRHVLEDRRVILIDDSIIRGTTSQKIVRMIRNAGAREVHFRVSSPPTIGPCFYGIDTPKREELIAYSHSVDEIAHYIDADTLAYLSHESLLASVGGERDRFCSACFTNRYPVAVPEGEREQMKLFEKVRD